jgi:hypothetical protein
MLDLRSMVNDYRFECELPGSGEKVEFRPITTGQMKGLLVYENDTDPFAIENALDDLITGCVITPGFDVKELFLQDRLFLLIEIRKKTKGSNYTFKYTCPKCETDVINTVNLDELPVTRWDKNADNLIRLKENLSVKMRLIKRGDQIDAVRAVKKMKVSSPARMAVEVATYMYAAAMDEFVLDNGETGKADIEDKIYLIDNTGDSLFNTVKKWLEDNDFGVNLYFDFSCFNCKWGARKFIPVNDFFV